MTRPRPKEEAVRDALREEAGAGAGSVRTGPAEAAGVPNGGGGGEAPAPPAAPDAPPASPATGEPGAEAKPADAPAPSPEPTEEDPLATATRERAQYLALAQRTQADFENFRKRAIRERDAASARGRLALLRELLPAVDNLERALAAASNGDEGLAGGVKLVLADLHGLLERNGAQAIDPAGERFDPVVHEALTTRADPGAQPGIVLDVVQKGYRTGDLVIRPARVVVSA